MSLGILGLKSKRFCIKSDAWTDEEGALSKELRKFGREENFEELIYWDDSVGDKKLR